MFKASLALIASLALSLAFTAPAGAAGSPFADNAKAAVAKADPSLQLGENMVRKTESLLDPNQTVETDIAAFSSAHKVVLVIRTVGAVPVLNGDTAVGRVLLKQTVKRAHKGTRNILISTTASQYGPGLNIAAWTERTGVNYHVVSRTDLDRDGLLKVVKALPADTTTVPRKTRNIIRSARPIRPQAEPLRSASSLFVDGAGDVNDDWGDEATLCNGCSYYYSNYTWMWQKVLWADGYLPSGSIDCYFGAQTASATSSWQSGMGLTADGIVGINTRRAADDFLYQPAGTNQAVYPAIPVITFDRSTSNANAYYYNSKKISYQLVTLC